MEDLRFRSLESKETHSAICAVAVGPNSVCGMKFGPFLNDRAATKALNDHISNAHSNKHLTIGYVNFTSVIDTLKLTS